MTWGHMSRYSTTKKSIKNIDVSIYNFCPVWPKIILVSLELEWHPELDDT